MLPSMFWMDVMPWRLWAKVLFIPNEVSRITRPARSRVYSNIRPPVVPCSVMRPKRSLCVKVTMEGA